MNQMLQTGLHDYILLYCISISGGKNTLSYLFRHLQTRVWLAIITVFAISILCFCVLETWASDLVAQLLGISSRFGCHKVVLKILYMFCIVYSNSGLAR